MKPLFRLVLQIIAIILVFGVPFVTNVIFYLNSAIHNNDNYVATFCAFTNYKYMVNTCPRYICFGKNSKAYCFDGQVKCNRVNVTVSWQTTEGTTFSQLLQYDDYPPGDVRVLTNDTCYYYPDDPWNYHLSLSNVKRDTAWVVTAFLLLIVITNGPLFIHMSVHHYRQDTIKETGQDIPWCCRKTCFRGSQDYQKWSTDQDENDRKWQEKMNQRQASRV